MKNLITNTKGNCKKFLQLSMFSLLTLFICADLYAGALKRKPASAVPDEEVLTAPFEQKLFIQTFLAEDDAGVMRGVRNSLESYQQTEEYAQKWHLESTGLYNTPTASEKKHLIARNILKYADKRLSGEIKNAEEGSAMYSVGKAEKTLRPNTNVPISKNVALKFKLRVLQGKAIMEVKNPIIDTSATVTANGKLRVITVKEFKDLGFAAGAEFKLSEGESIIYADQELTKNIKARLSTNQTNHQQAFSHDADKRVEMMASFPFNF